MAACAGGGVSIVYESCGSEWCLSEGKNVQWLVVESSISRIEAVEVNKPFTETGLLLLPHDGPAVGQGRGWPHLAAGWQTCAVANDFRSQAVLDCLVIR